MKLILAFTLIFSSFGAFAQKDLDSMKQKANSHIDKKLTSLETAKSCINAANNMDKFKACKYDMHEEMKKTKMQAMEEKKQELEE